MSSRTNKIGNTVIMKAKSLSNAPFNSSEPSFYTDFPYYIRSIHARLVRFLERILDGSLLNKKPIKELQEELLTDLNFLSKSPSLEARNFRFSNPTCFNSNGPMGSYDLGSTCFFCLVTGEKSVSLHRKVAHYSFIYYWHYFLLFNIIFFITNQ